MTAVQRLVSNGNSIINFLKNFSSATAQDVSVDWVNDDDTIDTKTFANIKKFQDSVDIKNDASVLKNNAGDVIVLDASNLANAGGKVLAHYQDIQTAVISSTDTVTTVLSITLTPKSSTSKFLIQAQVNISGGLNTEPSLNLMRDTSKILIGDARGARNRCTICLGNDYFNGAGDGQTADVVTIQFIDSPATASEIVYKIDTTDFSGPMYINSDGEDPDSSGEGWTGTSTLIITEIEGA